MEAIGVEMKSLVEKVTEVLPKCRDSNSILWQTNENPSPTKSQEKVSCKTCDIDLENRTQLLEHMRLKHKAIVILRKKNIIDGPCYKLTSHHTVVESLNRRC